jgi:glycerol-3-phosphate acyltransferase PlsY
MIAGISFIVVKGITRHASAGSLAACVGALLATFLSTDSFALRGMVLALVVMVVIRHHTNIRRLLGGKELDS